MSSNRKKILEGLFLYSFSRTGVKVFAFLSFLFITKGLSLSEYGQLQLFFAVLAPASALISLNLDKLVVADAAALRGQNSTHKAQRLFKQYFSLSSILFVLVLGLGFAAHNFLSNYFKVDLSLYFWPVAALIIGQLVMNFASMVFTAFEHFRGVAILQIGEAVARLLFVLLFFFTDQITVLTILWAYVGSKFVVPVLTFPWVLRLLKAPVGTESKENLLGAILKRHGKWEVSNGMVDTLVGNLWPWILNFFGGTVAVGVYGFAEKIISFINAGLPVDAVLFPIISRSVKEKKEVAKLIIIKAKKYTFFLLLFTFILGSLLVKPVIEFFVPQYVGAVPYIIVLMFNLCLGVFAIGQSAVLYAYQQQKVMFGARGIILTARLVLQIVLVSLFGIWGLVFSVICMDFLTSAIREYILRKRLNFSLWEWEPFFTFDQYDRIVLQSLREKALKIFRRSQS